MGPLAIRSATTALAFDDRPVTRRIGLLVLATDHTTEPDFRRIVASHRIGVYTARIAYANPTTPDNLRRMRPRLTDGAGLILPGESLDAICYSCTSASVVIGDDAVEAAIRDAKPNVPVITPSRAAVQALNALGARRISILTPYTVETSAPMAEYFAARGFQVLTLTCFGLEDDRVMARVSPASLVAAGAEAAAADAEALFISCTALRSAGVTPAIERAIGRPVVTSNLATAWTCLRLCGVEEPRPDLGRLMTLPAPAETQAGVPT